MNWKTYSDIQRQLGVIEGVVCGADGIIYDVVCGAVAAINEALDAAVDNLEVIRLRAEYEELVRVNSELDQRIRQLMVDENEENLKSDFPMSAVCPSCFGNSLLYDKSMGCWRCSECGLSEYKSNDDEIA